MRSLRHLTPRYIWNRLALMIHERKNPEQPWLTKAMIEILETWLKPEDVGLEFGSGRSTRWFAHRVGHLISVEHNPEWHRIVSGQLSGVIGKSVDYRLCEDGATNLNATTYVEVASEIAPASLDFCLVDGVARDHCALASLDKIKPGGILVVDNVNWYVPQRTKPSAPNSRTLKDGYASAVWQVVGDRLQGWRCVWTSNGVTDTAFWVRPFE